MTARASTVADTVQDLVARGVTSGLQVSAQVGDVVVEDAAGVDALGRPVDVASVSSWFCATKLLTSLCLATLADEGTVPVSTRLGDVAIGASDAVRDLTIWQLLTHSSGLWGERAERYMGLGAEAALAALGALRLRRRRPFEGAYGEYAAFHLAGAAAERVAGVPFEHLVASRVIDRAGLAGQIWFRTADGIDLDQLRLSSTADPAGPVPWLWERATPALESGSPANGAYGTATGFRRLAQHVGEVASRPGAVATAALVQPATRHGRCPVLGRRCRFSFGLLASLVEHDFDGLVSATAVGQVGLGGAATVVLDPAARRWVAWRDLVVHESAAEILEVRRAILGALSGPPARLGPSR